MDLSTVIFLSFIGSIFFLYRFSHYSRFLAKGWKLTPEESERYTVRARSALIGAAVMGILCMVSLLAAMILFFIKGRG